MFVEAFAGFLDEDAVFAEALFPIVDGAERDAEGGLRDFAGSGVAASGAGPGEKGEDGSGRAGVVAEVEVVGSGVVEVDGALDEAQA